MNRFLFNPTDLLFFRDGRPMGGSLSGHGDAWPLPTVTNAALHAALHRGGDTFSNAHSHRRGRSGKYVETRDRRFGSLLTAGPFPVLLNGKEETWLFPRPLDAGIAKDGDREFESPVPTFIPMRVGGGCDSSLAKPLQYPITNTAPPTKKTPGSWWTKDTWAAYLEGGVPSLDKVAKSLGDDDFADTESAYGIGMDDTTGTQDGERFYSAHSLRLRPGWRLGLLASAHDKGTGSDLLEALFPNSGAETPVIVGGQERLCTVRRDHPGKSILPMGRRDGFAKDGDKILVKWTLLSPAIFPQITKDGKTHTGGWLPNWIEHVAGEVQLLDGPGKNAIRRMNPEKRKAVAEGQRINATLVAALVGKPLAVTGYALAHEEAGRSHGAPKPTLLAVPAGSVYYFTTTNEESAEKLANALNWHGNTSGADIKNRRSTLFGEKGFGLGVCGTWQYLPASNAA